jgi:TonB family protein
MEQSSLSSASRKNADQNLRTILLAGLGGSMALHTVAIAGVNHFWKPSAAVDEPMEITMVDVDKTPPVPAVAKSAPKPVVFKPAAKIAPPVVPIVKVPAQVVLPKPAPKVIPPIEQPIPIVKTSATLTPKPSPKASKPIDKVSTKPVNAPKATPKFPDELFQPKPQPTETNNTPTPKPDPVPEIAKNDQIESPTSDNQSGLASAPSAAGLAGKLSSNPNPNPDNASNNGEFGAVAPSKIGASGDVGASSDNQSGLVGSSSGGGKLARGGSAGDVLTSTGGEGDFGTVAPSKTGASSDAQVGGSSDNQSGLVSSSSGGGKLARGFGGGNDPGNGSNAGDGDFGTVSGQGNTWRGARGEPGGGLSRNSGNDGDGEGSGSGLGVFGLQCISRCEISGLTDLEDNDGGKDKLRIKIAIDRQGVVIRASVAKSSGNAKIDRVVINGVKQMQFSPPGKTVERVVKANILI